MKEITLNYLILDHFKGIIKSIFDPKGRNATLQGDNGTGKTSHKDAFLWLFFGKDSNDRTDFAIKTIDKKTGEEMHHLDHTVKCGISINDSKTDLERIYKEKWTKKRGEAKPSFTNHVTDYIIDDVPLQKNEWDKKLSELIDYDTFRLISDPMYFNSLHWEKRREILTGLNGGDISDDAVIQQNEELKGIREILGDHSFEERKKIAKASLTKLNAKIKEFGPRIDELKKSIAGSDALDREAIEQKIEDLEAQLETLKDDSSLAGYRKEKADLLATLAELRNDYNNADKERVKEYEANLSKLAKAASEIKDKLTPVETKMNDLDRSIKNKKTEKDDLLKRWQSVQESIFSGLSDIPDDFLCPECGYNLNSKLIKEHEEKNKKAKEKFNTDKSNTLEEIEKKGYALKDEIEKEQQDWNRNKEIREGLLKELKDNGEQQAQVKKDIDKTITTTSPEMDKIGKDIDKTQASIDKVLDLIDKAKTEAPDTKPIEEELKEERKKIAEIDAAEKNRKRIKELEEDEKKCSAEYEKLEGDLYILDLFEKSKAQLQEKEINAMFELVEFKMFDIQINGAINPTCITTVDKVPWGSGLNTGSEINAGLDIIRTLSNHYGVKAPIFIDHAESVTDILDIGTQTFKLVVDGDKPELEIIYH